MIRRISLVALALLLASGKCHGAGPDFDRDVAPILALHCLDCHGGAKPKGGLDLTSAKSSLAGGETGPAVVAGNLDESLLWERVDAGDMPPKNPLPAAEKQVLNDWITSGAKWGTDPIDPYRFSTSKRAGYDWWSLRPVRRPELPTVHETSWPRNPIDRFLLARLESAGLKPSPEADRRTLIRRLSFDLIGLPPEPEEVEAFVHDADPLAYEKLVDRLLASPHYGERWARHWLDVARFGESDGFEKNTPRRDAWPYRDWLIRSLNADMPYDHFARLQIAGDVLVPGDADAATATGFLVAGLHNTILGNDLMRVIARQDELEDIVGAVGQTFLGLTVNCARCHDHKFDPIPAADYYRLASSLGGVQHGEKTFPVESVQAEIARISREMAGLTGEINVIDRAERRTILAEQGKSEIADLNAPSPVASWDFRTGTHAGLTPIGDPQISSEGVKLDGRTAYLRSKPIEADLREKTLEAWVRLDNLTQRGGGVISLEKPDGSDFDAIIFGEQEPGKWMAGSNFFGRTKSFNGPIESEAKERGVHVAITYAADGTIAGYREGKPYGKPYKSNGPARFVRGEAVVVFGLRHDPPGGNKMLAGTILKARIYDRALSPEEVAASAANDGGIVDEPALVARLSPETKARRQAIKHHQEQLAARRKELEPKATTHAYLAVSGPAPVTRLLVRGQVTEPGEVIAPGGVAVLGGTSRLSPDATDADRRRGLAEWMTGRENPLFGRVMVNRLWHYHFGVGLVETPNDFGFNGGRPSHPELLDWLATEFADQGYRLKPMHRLIVTSAAYRQASGPDARAMAIDADNRLVWRKSPRRLDAESVRDAILATSGLLNREVGGKGFSDYRESLVDGITYYEPFDPAGRDSQRRSIYRFTPRGATQGLLDTFDCPDSANAAPRRSTTTTPLQALALWNDAFVFRAADALAGRLAREIPGPETAEIRDRRLRRAWQLLFQRDPRPAELAAARGLIEKHGWKAPARALFNANEFLAVE